MENQNNITNTNQNQEKIKVFLIRHGQSIHNKEVLEIQQNNKDKHIPFDIDPENINSKFLKEKLDCELSDQGKLETQQAKIQMKNKNIKLVIVSPLLRALQTCDLIFQDHPNNPKVIVDPLIREACISSCDIGSNILNSIEIFKTNMDFSQMNQFEYKPLWVLDELSKQNKQVEFLKQMIKIQCEKDGKKLYESQYSVDLFLEHLKKIYPFSIENQVELYLRSKQIKQKIRDYIKQFNLQNQGEIALVGHSRCFRSLTGNLNQNFENCDYKIFNNCECFEYEF